LEAHERAFAYFGGVFSCLRYDNLSSAVKRILRGQQREQTERFVAFRSHWGFTCAFCNPGQGHEKGGVEGEVGYFRRNHLVPVPTVENLVVLNQLLLDSCLADHQRRITERTQTVGDAFQEERRSLQPLAAEGFDLSEVGVETVDGQGCVRVRTNCYSTPLRPGRRIQIRLSATAVEVWHEGQRFASHERCYGRARRVLDLEHYLECAEPQAGCFSPRHTAGTVAGTGALAAQFRSTLAEFATATRCQRGHTGHD
jgi:hypothetical protein